MNELQLRQNFVNAAISYLGTQEGSSKHKYIIDTYNKITPLPQGYSVKYNDSWCATFVSFVAKITDNLDIVPAECSCNRQIALWKKLGRWEENDACQPKVGDIIYYSWSDSGAGDCTGSSDHVGIVAFISGSNITVIEGNKNDAVSYRNIAVNGKFIRGYGKPNFASKATSSEESVFSMELKVLKKGSNGEQVKALQILLMGRGYSLPKYGADGSYGDETVRAVKAFQKAKNIAVDGIAGKDTFSKLLGV